MQFAPVLPDGTVLSRPAPRSLWALAALAAGFIGARYAGLPGPAVLLSLSAAACAIATLTRGQSCKVALWLAAAALAAGLYTARFKEAHDLPLPESGLVTVEGVILQTPQVRLPDRDPLSPPFTGEGVRTRILVRRLVTETGSIPVHARLWVHAGQGRGPAAGDHVRLTGIFAPVRAPMNPGEWDRRLWALQDGYAGSLRVPSLELATPCADIGAWGSLQSQWLRCRAWLDDRAHALLLAEHSDERGRALLAALILGDEEPALRESRGAFNRLGLAHILSISGFHIAVMTAVGLILLRATGDLGWLEPALTAALIAVYLAILPFNAPVWRSGLMILGLMLGDALGRRHDRLGLLGWIAVVLLLWRPLDLWSIGFQLSFGLVAVLIWLGKPFHARLFGMRILGPRPVEPTIWSGLRGALAGLVSTNILCWAAATPLVMYHTGLISPVAVLTGLVLVPLITLVLIAGYAVMLLGVFIPGTAAAHAIASLAAWTQWLVQRIDELPGTSLRVPPVSALWTIAATLAILWWLARGTRRSGLAIAAVAGVWLAVETWPRLPRGTALRVDTLAVGDGTCHLVRSGREALLWDCGSLTPGVGRMLVPRAVRSLGAGAVPTVIITHPNLDHFNGVLDIVEPLGVRRVLIGRAFMDHATRKPASPEAYLLQQLRLRGVDVAIISAGTTLDLGPSRVQFLSPPADVDWTIDNDMSLVATIITTTTPARTVFLCGDIQDRAIAFLGGLNLHPDIMEAPHHGSGRDAAVSFVTACGPGVVLQSTGASRAGDDRWDAVRRASTWLCTARDGAVSASVMRDGSIRAGSTPR